MGSTAIKMLDENQKTPISCYITDAQSIVIITLPSTLQADTEQQ
jgi:hypothetical protein